jgi:hypothetical protein
VDSMCIADLVSGYLATPYKCNPLKLFELCILKPMSRKHLASEQRKPKTILFLSQYDKNEKEAQKKYP